jgi:hypothetical protein
VRVSVCGVEPLTVTEDGRLQDAGLLAAVGEMEQLKLRVTEPVKPLDGVTVTVDVFPVVAPGSTEIAVPEMVMLVTARVTESVAPL